MSDQQRGFFASSRRTDPVELTDGARPDQMRRLRTKDVITMPSAKLTAVVVGCGVGSKHADAYNHSNATDLVGICDLDEARLQSVADEHDVEARYTDLETML